MSAAALWSRYGAAWAAYEANPCDPTRRELVRAFYVWCQDFSPATADAETVRLEARLVGRAA